MTVEHLNRLLRRQIKKHNLPSELVKEYNQFFLAVNEAYRSYNSDLEHLENILEINSKELYLANKLLSEENRNVTAQALKSKQQLDKVLANIRDIIFEVDLNGNFTYLNSAWIKYGEASAKESIGRNFMDFSDGIVHFDQTVLQQILKKDFSVFQTIFSRYDKNGVLKWWEMNVKLQRCEKGMVKGAIGSLIDVTKMKDTAYQLKKANLAKSSFLSTMSHEIRTPLNAVIAISNILLMDEPKESQLNNLNALKFSSKHLLNLINDILDYNKLINGKLVFDESPFNLRHILQGTLNSFSFGAKDKNLELIKQVDASIPDGVRGDSLRLSQVLTNLIGNAIKFTESGSVTLCVKNVEESEDVIKLRFAVIDTGIGIPKDKQRVIFDRFTQANAGTSKLYGGTGLGLSICKKLINLQDSVLELESVVGEGTTFSFDLEFGKVEKVDLTQIDAEQETKFDLHGMKMLVVDDNEMNLMVISQILDKWNVEIETASNGLEAVEKVTDCHYDLVMMDLMMPVMDGYEAVNKIRNLGSQYAGLPIIALSASVSNEVFERVLDAGMNDYLSKPFDPVDLYRKIHKYSNKKEKVKT